MLVSGQKRFLLAGFYRGFYMLQCKRASALTTLLVHTILACGLIFFFTGCQSGGRRSSGGLIPGIDLPLPEVDPKKLWDKLTRSEADKLNENIVELRAKIEGSLTDALVDCPACDGVEAKLRAALSALDSAGLYLGMAKNAPDKKTMKQKIDEAQARFDIAQQKFAEAFEGMGCVEECIDPISMRGNGIGEDTPIFSSLISGSVTEDAGVDPASLIPPLGNPEALATWMGEQMADGHVTEGFLANRDGSVVVSLEHPSGLFLATEISVRGDDVQYDLAAQYDSGDPTTSFTITSTEVVKKDADQLECLTIALADSEFRQVAGTDLEYCRN